MMRFFFGPNGEANQKCPRCEGAMRWEFRNEDMPEDGRWVCLPCRGFRRRMLVLAAAVGLTLASVILPAVIL